MWLREVDGETGVLLQQGSAVGSNGLEKWHTSSNNGEWDIQEILQDANKQIKRMAVMGG